MTIFFGTVWSTNDNAWTPAKWAKFMLVLTRLQISQYEFVLQKHCDYRLEKQTIMLRIVPQMLKKWRNVVNRISKVRQTTCNWIKKILDEATRIVNVFLLNILILLFVFIMFNKLVKYDFILRYEAWVNALRAAIFIENLPQISAKPIALQRNLLGKLWRNRPFFTTRFSARNWPRKFPRNSRKIGRFFREFVPENPAKFDFFSTTYQKPWINIHTLYLDPSKRVHECIR